MKAQAADLAATGHLDGRCTIAWDTLVMGVPAVLCNLSASPAGLTLGAPNLTGQESDAPS